MPLFHDRSAFSMSRFLFLAVPLLSQCAVSLLHQYTKPRGTNHQTTTRLYNEIPSLYQEQEKLLVARGEIEGEIMKGRGTPLAANVVKGAGAKGGFGGGGGSSTSQIKAQAKSHVAVLKEEGVVRIDNVLSPETADELREFVYNLRHESEELVKAGKIQPIERFADVLLKTNRCDMPIPLGADLVARALHEALIASPVGQTIANLLGNDAILYELSSLMSDPGSQRQVMHPDTPYHTNEKPVLYTCFIALQDIDLQMGPTTWLPRTHTMEMHQKFQDEQAVDGSDSPKDQLLKTQPAVLGCLQKGSCGIFDSRLLHCGGSNMSQTSRALFYFSFKNPSILNAGNPGSIRREYISLWTLAGLQTELKQWKKGKSCKLVE